MYALCNGGGVVKLNCNLYFKNETEETEEIGEIVETLSQTEDLKKYHSLTHLLTT